MPSKAVVFAVVSFLIVVLIYGPTVTFDVFAKPKLGPITCHTGQGVPPGQTECCQPTLSSITGRVLLVYCTTCDDTSPPSNCSPRYLTVGGAVGSVTNPPSGNNTGTQPFGGINKVPGKPTNALPTGNSTGTPGKTSIFNPVRNVTSALPVNNNTGTLPPGSIIKVPPGTIGSASNPPPTNNNTGNPIAMTSSDNPPGCSKKIPIPPNCTLNPFNNSVSNKAGTVGSATNPSNNTGTASLGNITKVPVNHTNALPTGSNTGTPPPALKLSQPSLAGQQPQTQQTTGHHHHKGSNTGASTSTGNSTGH